MHRPVFKSNGLDTAERSECRIRVKGLFDDLVGPGEDRCRYSQPERFGGLEVDDQLECRRLLDWQIGGLGAVEDLSDVNAELAISARDARSIADQGAGLGGLAPRVDRPH